MSHNPPLVQTQATARSAERLEPFFVYRLPTWKRGIDIIVALTGLIVFSPLFLLITVVIKIVSPGPVFFRQARVGHGGKLFRCWKFRTMQVGTDPAIHQRYVMNLICGGTDGVARKPMVKLDSGRDPRLIPLGRLLRQSCVDELPQLINVLRGEMSLVGPRPCLPYEAKEYMLWQTRRFDVTPGMTGLWQVSGKNRTTFAEMIRLDIAYVDQQSVSLDIKILLKTLPVIVSQVMDLRRIRRAYQVSTPLGLLVYVAWALQ